MKPTVYIETSIVSYLTARPSENALLQGQQELTRQWWRTRRDAFDLFTSQFVIMEARAGDPDAARERLAVLQSLPKLNITPAVEPLAQRLLRDGALPSLAGVDALHVAIAASSSVQYLLTWNCKHLANAALWRKIEQTCRAQGVDAPTICTPYELPGDES